MNAWAMGLVAFGGAAVGAALALALSWRMVTRHRWARLEGLAAELAEASDEVFRVLQERTEAATAALEQRAASLAVPAGAAAPAPAPPPAAAGPGADPYAALRQRVFGLADAGLDAQAIARELGMTRGEVQLLLSLRQLH